MWAILYMWTIHVWYFEIKFKNGTSKRSSILTLNKGWAAYFVYVQIRHFILNEHVF